MGLLDAYGHPISTKTVDARDTPSASPLALPDETTAVQMADELATLEESTGGCVLAISPTDLVCVVGLLQVALRHRGVSELHRAAADQVIAGARSYFVESPTITAFIERGDRHETHRE